MTEPSVFDQAVDEVREGADPLTRAAALAALLTTQERLDLLDGDVPFWPGMLEMMVEGYNLHPIPMGHLPRVGVPGVQFVDGPRGCVVGRSTAFPVSMARGATWDVALEQRIGEAIGREIRAQGGNFFGGVCINLPRYPGWGRAQETYGEDPLLLGEFGAALTRGTQRNVMACVKHYALNSMENARFTVDVQIDEAALHEFFLAHFRRVVDEGVCAVMSSYNSVNGQWAGQNPELLTRILRQDWGFGGFVITDFIWGMRDGTAALRAGLDVEAPFRQQRGAHLAADLAAGEADWADVDRAVLRILATQLRHYAARDAAEPGPDVVAGAEHRALAREAAGRSVVLLRNETVAGQPVLPLDPATLGRLAVVGRLADLPNTGDHGSSDVRAPEVVTALAGLTAALGGEAAGRIVLPDGPGARAAAQAAAGADAAVVIVGFTAADEGEYVGGDILTRPELVALYPEPSGETELAARQAMVTATEQGTSLVGGGAMGGDRSDLHLAAEDVELIRAVAAANARTVVVIVAAGAVQLEEWRDAVPAIAIGWYSGMEGGNGLADMLFGAVDASGRLPFSIPLSAAHLPDFDRDATSIGYDRWFGQRLLDRLGVAAAYPLGFGLSYTTFALSAVGAVRTSTESGTVRARVANTGGRAGRHVVQVYARQAGERFLVGFAPVDVPAGQAVEVSVPVSLRPIGHWDGAVRAVVVGAEEVALEVCAHAGDPRAALITLPSVAVPAEDGS